jgi:hypothetical protein
VLRLQASEEIKATADQSSPKSPPVVSKLDIPGVNDRDILSPVKIKQPTKTQLLSVSCPTCVLASECAAFCIQAVPGQHRMWSGDSLLLASPSGRQLTLINQRSRRGLRQNAVLDSGIASGFGHLTRDVLLARDIHSLGLNRTT